ncbi:hypothetical protein D9756_009740 [Leucocoprinus leucothites]|uniref:DUF6533 domain-containing protein n=1 Tax=Leucocoprinus leucothites TaxID=201217 RepID=A0A8H5CY65_9AGAR|nr:hypothetical protein D9756_009740 [Leucoagaricus leucothites]
MELFQLPPEVLSSLYHYEIGRYSDGAAAAFFIYDYLLTLNLEVQLIWESPWSIPKALFLLNRYLPFLEFILNYFRDNVGGMAPYCYFLLHVITWLYIAGIFLSEIILTLRVLAIWRMKTPLIIGSIILNIVDFAIIGTVAELTIHPLRFFDLPPFTGCLTMPSNSLLFIGFIVATVYDVIRAVNQVMLVFMIIPFMSIKRKYAKRHKSQCFEVMYTEGVLFYVYLLALSTITFLLMYYFRDNLFTFVYVARILRAVLASRMVLHLRYLYRKGSHMELTSVYAL